MLRPGVFAMAKIETKAKPHFFDSAVLLCVFKKDNIQNVSVRISK